MNLLFDKRHKLHKDAGKLSRAQNPIEGGFSWCWIIDEEGILVLEYEDDYNRLLEKFKWRRALVDRLNEAHTLTFDFGEDNTILINGKTVDNRYWDLPKSEQDVEVYYKAITEEFVSSQNLSFIETMTMEEFKVDVGTSRVSVIRNPKTGKLFAVDTADNTIAAVTESALEAPEVRVSIVVKANGEEFYLIHPVQNEHRNPSNISSIDANWSSDETKANQEDEPFGEIVNNLPEFEDWQLYQQTFNEPVEGDRLSQSWSEDYHPNEEDWNEFVGEGEFNGQPPFSSFGKEAENNDMSSDGVYITNANLKAHILRTTDLMKVEIDGPVYKSFIGFFNKLERNELLAVRELFKDPKRFFSYVYKPYTPKDTYTLVYEGIKPAYHSSIKCSALNADYRNYEVPSEIRNQGKQEVSRFRAWFMPRAYLLQKNPDKFDKEFFEKWGFEANLKKLFAPNRGSFLLKNFKTFEEREMYIESLLREAKSFAEKSDKHRIILSHFQKDSWQGVKGKLRKRNKTGYTDAEVLEVLEQFELEHKRPIKFQLIEYYKHRYNPNLEFAKNDLEALGFAPCGKCLLNDAFGDLGFEIS